MGQVNSTEAGASQHIIPDPAPVPTSSTTSSIPSVEDLRDMTSRILSSTNDAVKSMRENIPALELPSIFPSSSSSSDSGSSLPSATDSGVSSTQNKLDHFAESSSDMVTSGDYPYFVHGSYVDNSDDSVTDLIRIHYHLSANWIRKNAVMISVGVLVAGVAITAGAVAIKASRAHRLQKRRARVLRAKDGAKREVVVLTNVSTLEGVALALSLDQQGFVVFVGVPNQDKAIEVERWRRNDIHPVIVDYSKTNPVKDLVHAVTSFLDQKNNELLGGGPVATPTSIIFEEELSASIANIQVVSSEHTLKSVSEAEAKRRHHGKTDSPLFRLAAVIVNPHSAVVGSIEKVDMDQWRQSIDCNITGTVITAQQFMPTMRRTLALAKPRRSPRLILVSSAITGSIGFPYQSAICASHHAIESIADSLRREIKHQGIDVICIRPGVADTQFRKEWVDKKANAGDVGLLSTLDPTQILKSTFKTKSTTTFALCEATFDAITQTKPSPFIRVGSGSLAYSFVGWAAPRYVVDWSIEGKPVKVRSAASVKVTTTKAAHEE
ncbi:hypothetical protein BGZ94_001611 [Podila epigama]|nr:hypothetical protein BGZ94_001611 [Podila epigama]